MIALVSIAIMIGVFSAMWDERTIRKRKKLNHYLHAGVRGVVYGVLGWLAIKDPVLIVAGWFIVTPTHRLMLNGFMGWSMFYVGSTAWYDRALHWLADKANIDEVGQFITVFEVLVFTVIVIFAL